MVTIEIALAIPMVLLVTVAAAVLLAAGHMQARTTDAARAAARELARGESPAAAVAAAHRVVPDGEVRVVRDEDVIEVRVTREVRGPGPLLGQVRRTVSGTAVTRREGLP